MTRINTIFRALLALGLTASTLLTAQQSTISAQVVTLNPAIEQKLSIPAPSELATLDSGLYSDIASMDVIGQVFEGLYRIKNSQEVELGQAASVKVSEDGLTHTFTLRDDIYWSNGDPVKAQDFELAFRRLADRQAGTSVTSIEILKNGAAIRNGDKPVEELGVKALDDKTLELTLEYPVPALAKILTGSRYMPINKAFFQEKGDSYGTTADNVVTNGPFTIQGWNGTNLEWDLVKNPQYWDASHVYLTQVHQQVIKENSTGADLFDSNQLDFTTLSDQFVQEYSGAPDFHSIPKATIGYLSFNTTRPTTGNAALRRAIAQAFDKQVYADSVIQDGSQPLNNLVPKAFDVNESGEDYQEQAGPMLTYDVQAAQADWAKAKEELGQETIELQLLTSDVGLSKRTAEFLKEELEKNLPGLKLSVLSVPLKNRLEIQRKLDYDIFYGTWTPEYQDAVNFIEQYKTGGGTNFAKYANPEFDKLVELARNDYAKDPAKRRETLIEAEKILVKEDGVVAPIYQASAAYLLKPKVKQFEVLPFGRSNNLRPVYIDE